MKKLLFVTLLLSMLACQNQQQEGTPVTGNSLTPVAATPPPAAKPEVFFYMVTVDNLLLRDQPTRTGSKVIDKMQTGAFLEASGVVSPNKEEAEIHGIPMKEPYVEITTATGKGWAYGGALLRVYAGPRSTIPDIARLNQFGQFIKTLNFKKLESGKKLLDYVKANFGNASGSLADAVYFATYHVLMRLNNEGELYTLTEKHNWADADYEAVYKGTFDMQRYPELAQLAAAGYSLAEGEGSIFPVIDQKQLHNFFVSKVTPAMKNYLEETLLEDQNQAWSEGGLRIPMEQLADRAAFWEKFNRDHPYFPATEECQEHQRYTTLVLFNGDDYTPSYDSETNMIREEFKKGWAYIIQHYPDLELGKKAKEITDMCTADGWKHTQKVADYQMKMVNAYSAAVSN